MSIRYTKMSFKNGEIHKITISSLIVVFSVKREEFRIFLTNLKYFGVS